MDKQKQFLLVDDSITARSYLKSVLEDADFGVIEASDGQEALNSIEEALPDAMVLDLLMPEMDGFEVLKVLKEKNISFPIIVLTADVQDQVREECLELGAAAVLHKPFSSEDLLKILNIAIK